VSTKVTIEFDDEEMASAFVANLLDGGGGQLLCDFNEKTNELEYFDFDSDNSIKDNNGRYKTLRYRRASEDK
jgi:hypothetical protein